MTTPLHFVKAQPIPTGGVTIGAAMLCVACKQAEAQRGSVTKVVEAGGCVTIITGLRATRCESCESVLAAANVRDVRELSPEVHEAGRQGTPWVARHVVGIVINRFVAVVSYVVAWLSL